MFAFTVIDLWKPVLHVPAHNVTGTKGIPLIVPQHERKCGLWFKIKESIK